MFEIKSNARFMLISIFPANLTEKCTHPFVNLYPFSTQNFIYNRKPPSRWIIHELNVFNTTPKKNIFNVKRSPDSQTITFFHSFYLTLLKLNILWNLSTDYNVESQVFCHLLPYSSPSKNIWKNWNKSFCWIFRIMD
jgi:hypothetical protein